MSSTFGERSGARAARVCDTSNATLQVKELNGEKKTASIKTMSSNSVDEISFDYCLICSGCNFGPFKPMGESLWFPTVHEEGRAISDWKHIDERFLEGRRRHVIEEYHKLQDLNKKKATILAGAQALVAQEPSRNPTGLPDYLGETWDVVRFL